MPIFAPFESPPPFTAVTLLYGTSTVGFEPSCITTDVSPIDMIFARSSVPSASFTFTVLPTPRFCSICLALAESSGTSAAYPTLVAKTLQKRNKAVQRRRPKTFGRMTDTSQKRGLNLSDPDGNGSDANVLSATRSVNRSCPFSSLSRDPTRPGRTISSSKRNSYGTLIAPP
jgi:hypothetical protein